MKDGLQLQLASILEQHRIPVGYTSSVVFLVYPYQDTIAVPDSAAIHVDLCDVVLRDGQPHSESIEDGQLHYFPLFDGTHCLGVAGFHFLKGVEFSPAHMELLCQHVALIVSHAENDLSYSQQQFLRIYEALPEIDLSSDMDSQMRCVADTFRGLEWPYVRIVVDDHHDGITRTYSSAEEDANPATFEADQRGLPQQLGLAQYFPQPDENGYVSLHIPVESPDANLNGRVELYRFATPNPPTEASILPLLIFTRHFGNVIDRTKLILSLRETADLLTERVNELEFIRKADRELSTRLDPERITRLTLDLAMRRTLADAGMLAIIDRVSKTLQIKDSIGFPDALHELAEDQVWPDIRGVIGRAMVKEETQLVPDVSTDPDYVEILPDTITQLSVPLVSNARMVGVISLESAEPQDFDARAADFIERIASIAAVALDNAQLLQQSEQLADDMSLIHGAVRAISTSLEWSQAIQSIAQSMAKAVNASGALIYSYDDKRQQAQLLSKYEMSFDGEASGWPPTGSIWDMSKSPSVVKTLHEGAMLILTQPDAGTRSLFKQLKVSAVGIAPLNAQGETVGLAVLVKNRAPEVYATSEIFVAESLATQAAAVMRQAQLYAELRDIEKAKTVTITMAAHDLKAPLSNITGYVNLLEMDVKERTDEIQFFIDTIQRNLDTMETLIRDLLNLEEIESQRYDSWKPVKFGELVNQVVADHEDSAALKNHTLKKEISKATVRGIGRHLQQAVTNFVSNAIKYTPDGGTIQVKVYRGHSELPRIHFEVLDNGLGIPEERQKRLFERFYRAKQEGTDHISGTGLGLSLVKTVVEQHGGDVYFASVSGEGSTFGFWLPVPD